MSNTRKAHISTKEQFRLITECRQNGQTAPLTRQTSPDSSHTIEVTMRDVCIRIKSDADLPLLSRALHLIRKILC